MMLYYCESEEMAKLVAIMKRLYHPDILGYDERRDLAHRLELAIDNIKVNIAEEQ